MHDVHMKRAFKFANENYINFMVDMGDMKTKYEFECEHLKKCKQMK